jgi:hypothetical protein
MEFEEMQKVWDEQKGETMYVINEAALHRSVTRKKNAASRRISRLEINVTIINSATAIFLLILMLNHPRLLGFINAGIVAATVVYIQYFRWKRKKAESTFDRRMLGELDHAISNANSIIRFNYLMLVGYLLPLSVVGVSSLIVKGAGLEKWLITTGMFVLAIFLVRWEQKACNIPRKKQLLALKKKLMEE